MINSSVKEIFFAVGLVSSQGCLGEHLMRLTEAIAVPDIGPRNEFFFILNNITVFYLDRNNLQRFVMSGLFAALTANNFAIRKLFQNCGIIVPIYQRIFRQRGDFPITKQWEKNNGAKKSLPAFWREGIEEGDGIAENGYFSLRHDQPARAAHQGRRE